MNFDPDSFLDKVQSMLSSVSMEEEEQSDISEEGSDDEDLLSEEEGSEGGEEEGREVREATAQMDMELADTSVAGSFQKVSEVHDFDYDFNLLLTQKRVIS